MKCHELTRYDLPTSVSSDQAHDLSSICLGPNSRLPTSLYHNASSQVEAATTIAVLTDAWPHIVPNKTVHCHPYHDRKKVHINALLGHHDNSIQPQDGKASNQWPHISPPSCPPNNGRTHFYVRHTRQGYHANESPLYALSSHPARLSPQQSPPQPSRPTQMPTTHRPLGNTPQLRWHQSSASRQPAITKNPVRRGVSRVSPNQLSRPPMIGRTPALAPVRAPVFCCSPQMCALLACNVMHRACTSI